MSQPYDYFVLFAEMRTGSNFLETNLNEIDGLSCYGEAFNPHFLGYPKTEQICGCTLAMREADPGRLIKDIQKKTEGLGGFRYFHDHDPRILDQMLDDPRCAKIILTRNPVESYVSWKIASETGQWKLTDMKHKKSAQIKFDAAEFEGHLSALQGFQVQILNRLQTSGQAAFYIGYEDINSVEVLNGLAAYLGVEGRLEAVSKKLKKQNPSSLEDKVRNFDEMQEGLARADHFALNRTPNFEPRRHAMVPSYVGGAETPVLYMPVKCGPEAEVQAWMAELDGVGVEDLAREFTQKTLRQWKRQRPGHRSFTVLRHPVERAHAAFCQHILSMGPGAYVEIRRSLRRNYNLPIPEDEVDASYDAKAHQAAFLAFMAFVKGNLNGQTAIRVDPAWASQTEVLKGLGGFTFPDLVLREDDLALGLSQLCQQLGVDCPKYRRADPDHPVLLSEIYNADVEAAVRDAYQRDYMMFGFKAWG